MTKTDDRSLRAPSAALLGPLQRELDRFFEQMGSGLPSLGEFGGFPRLDVKDTPDLFEVTAELPGIQDKDVRVEVEDRLLTISGEKRSESERSDKDYRISERHWGGFSRSITLPKGVDPETVKATLKDGVLTLTATKTETGKARTISIESAQK